MSLQRAFAIAASGLTAQRTRMESVASNLANARTTRTPEGGPYRRQAPIFVSQPLTNNFDDMLGSSLRAVRVDSVATETMPPILRYEPGHPDADESGFVAYPNVDPVREMIDMLSATRSYEANVTVVRGVREMSGAALEILT